MTVALGPSPSHKEGSGTILDLVDSIKTASTDNNQSETMLPACQRIADSEKYHCLFMDPLISDHIIQRIARHEHDAVVSNIMKKSNIKEDEAEMIFRFILNGSFAVNRSLNWQKGSKWYKFQTLITKFVNGGFDEL